MILKASQRGGASQLGSHLLKPENEHVELHEVRGFMADDVMDAMKEAQAVACGTRCKQFLFSVSLNPPANENVPTDAFERAVEAIEEKNGLAGQPRIIIFHEKEGRRHCHAVWSRIDADTMTARPLPFFKTKLQDVARSLYLEHGWQMPRGLANGNERDPRNFSLAEWQQAKRIGHDPAAIKATVQECWASSDSGPAFAAALEQRGLFLARGDRRAHVAVTYEGEVLSLARLIGKKAKEVVARLGDPEGQRSVAETRAHIADVVAPRLAGLLCEANAKRVEALAPLEAQRLVMRQEHRASRQKLDEGHKLRQAQEAKERTARLRGGLMGLWDRLTGRTAKVRKQNEAEAALAMGRDRAERQGLVGAQLGERRGLQRDIRAAREHHAALRMGLHRDLVAQRQNRAPEKDGGLRSSFGKAAAATLRRTESGRGLQSRSRGDSQRNRGPDLGR